jgi:mRNA-degrading endonuclease RelE of RelBE toxin-antitoxin system
MNLKRNWVLKIDPEVYKDLSKFPKDYAKKISEIIEKLPYNPYLGDIEKIKGEKHLWRRRIGSYRIFYELYPDKNLIHILWVERRTSKTY